MAWHLKVKLPSFKLTQRSGDSTKEVLVPRGRTSQTVHKPKEEEGSNENLADDGVDFSMLSDMGVSDYDPIPDPQQPSLHTIKQKANVAAWDNVRANLRCVAVECSAMPIDQECILCPSPAEYRCIECAAWAYFCSQCFGEVHLKVGIFHTGEVWQVRMYR